MKILISVDGSDFSRAAVENCCRIIAEPDNTAIKIVSVYEIIEPMDISISPEFSRELKDSAHRKAEEFAAEAAAQIKERFPNIDLITQVSIGTPDKILLEAAEEWQADLIVVGSHGRGFWGRMLLGSVTDALVHHAPCSVLVVRKAAK
jgi:nucleotide-binding universal stress UspA family protein